jgi:hypothetical protein
MSHRHRRARRVAALVLPFAFAIPSVALAHGDGDHDDRPDDRAPYETVVEGLRNPRGIAMSDGKLYVAESGEGGDVCFAGVTGPEGGDFCVGLSGRISRINTRSGRRTDVVTGLLSLDGPLFAVGATGVAVHDDQVIGLMGGNDIGVPPADACGGGADCQAAVAAGAAQLGHLLRAKRRGRVAWKQDVGAVNYQWTIDNKDSIGLGDPAYQPGWADNPDFEPGDANPYALASARGGSYVVDGGSNTLTFVPRHGQPRIVAAFPNPVGDPTNAYDSVPTCVATIGRRVFVADLNGQIFMVDGSSTTVAPSAITSVDGAFLAAAGGCAADRKGNVYVSDIYVGSVVKVSTKTMTMSWVRPPGTLNFPTGVAIGEHGMVYVANNGVCPSFPTPVDPDNPCGGVSGSIVRFRP